ncbi:uncharacterized G-patch domain protein DDB_G0278987-like [Mercenaria mercenaria]|uniref:uncharacterized G-patch domain protein DDB_G0278987-like n=1 Tax=Mercenaria mercenaria TaxID=6596 RepID=UPI00234F0414|nr:uncharacterized G-patch domain protein DDB_G0278987-like [Mercenaria mercenaria]
MVALERDEAKLRKVKQKEELRQKLVKKRKEVEALKGLDISSFNKSNASMATASNSQESVDSKTCKSKSSVLNLASVTIADLRKSKSLRKQANKQIKELGLVESSYSSSDSSESDSNSETDSSDESSDEGKTKQEQDDKIDNSKSKNKKKTDRGAASCTDNSLRNLLFRVSGPDALPRDNDVRIDSTSVGDVLIASNKKARSSPSANGGMVEETEEGFMKDFRQDHHDLEDIESIWRLSARF